MTEVGGGMNGLCEVMTEMCVCVCVGGGGGGLTVM